MSTHLEDQVVKLIGEGWSRWKIAEKLELSEHTVREVIKRLCQQYDCSMRDLPDHYRKGEQHGY